MVLGQGWPKKLPRRKHPAEPNTGSAAKGPRNKILLTGAQLLGFNREEGNRFCRDKRGIIITASQLTTDVSLGFDLLVEAAA